VERFGGKLDLVIDDGSHWTVPTGQLEYLSTLAAGGLTSSRLAWEHWEFQERSRWQATGLTGSCRPGLSYRQLVPIIRNLQL